MTEPATDKSMITTTRRSGTETGNSSGSRAARKNSGPDGVRREPPSSAGKPLHGAVLLAALGIVYGDIGTSPIYTFRECLKAGSDGEVVLGLLSLIFWSLTIVVTTKYVLFVMRADNYGEGGIMALLGLAAHSEPDLKRRSALILLGIAGAALFYGDGMITPAISVLSAVEGLKVATPVLAPYVVRFRSWCCWDFSCSSAVAANASAATLGPSWVYGFWPSRSRVWCKSSRAPLCSPHSIPYMH